MPLYFFHAVNGFDVFTDGDGATYLDFASARVYAQRLARELKKSPTFDSFEIVVADAAGRELYRVAVKDQAEADPVALRK